MTIQEVDERIDMKLGIVLEAIDDKFAQFLEIIQGQTDQIIATQKSHGSKLDRLDTAVTNLQTDMEIVGADVQVLKQNMT